MQPYFVQFHEKALLQLSVRRSGYLARIWVADVQPTSEAELAGVTEGHVIVSINGEATTNMTLPQVRTALLADPPVLVAFLNSVHEFNQIASSAV